MSTVKKSTFVGLVVAVAGAFVIVSCLVTAMKKYSAPAPVNQARIKERVQALAEVRGVALNESESYGKIDATKGVYRLKISQAIALTEKMYKDPAAARAALIERAEKANFVPPPPKFE